MTNVVSDVYIGNGVENANGILPLRQKCRCYGILRHSTAFYGILRHSTAFDGILRHPTARQRHFRVINGMSE
jgi:hypothetical protein